MSNENEVMDTNTQMPSFLTEDAGMGTDNVQASQRIPELRVCTKMSRVFEDQQVELGHIYNVDTEEDLGPERQLIVFKYRTNFVCSNEDNTQIFCKSYDQKTGQVRVYIAEDFDEEFIEEMQITKEEVEGEDGIVERSCKGCEFHPSNWTQDEQGNNIPPRCNRSHEFYVLDVTDGFDKQPYLIRVNETSGLKKAFIKDWNNLIQTKIKLNQAPIFGGVFKLFGEQVENSRKKKNYIFGVEFLGFVSGKQKELYDFAKQSHIEFNKNEEEYNKNTEAVASDGDIDTDDDFEEGSAFGDNTEADDGDSVWPD
jgi:hypothetical protein